MESFLKHWGIALFLGGVYFSVAALAKEVGNPIYEWGAGGGCFAIALYQYIMGGRLAGWEDYQRHLREGGVGRERPKDPIWTIFQRITKKVRHQP